LLIGTLRCCPKGRGALSVYGVLRPELFDSVLTPSLLETLVLAVDIVAVAASELLLPAEDVVAVVVAVVVLGLPVFTASRFTSSGMEVLVSLFLTAVSRRVPPKNGSKSEIISGE